MKNIFLNFLLPLFQVISILSFGQPGTRPSATLQHATDSITISGKFISPCYIPASIKAWRFNVGEAMNTRIDIPVSSNGVFSYRIPVNGFQQFTLEVDQSRLDFLATPTEKTYDFEITCNTGKKIEIKNSYENQAFIQLYALSKTLNDSLTIACKRNITDKDKFPIFKKLLSDHQQKVSAIAQEYPRSYTAQVLCASEILPLADFSSIQQLRDNFLQREAFSNRQFYSCNFLTLRLLPGYFLILNENDTIFTGFGKALNIACKNQETGKLLEQLFYGIIFYQNKEEWLRGYINWAKLHPDKMYNPQVKIQLSNIENCIAGNPFSDIMLNDPAGVQRKLSEIVASAKLTLLIFYSPTCTHCMEVLPKIVPLWEQYKTQGFKIYAVGFEGTNEEWNDFMRTKGTSEWTNVFTTDNKVVFGGKYKVTTTPSLILIDNKGVIIRRFADLEYLQKEIPRYFAK